MYWKWGAEIPGKLWRIIWVVLGLVLVSSTSRAATLWTDDFTGVAMAQPANWEDDTEAPLNNYGAELAYSYTNSYAAMTRTSTNTWGKVFAATQSVDVVQYPMIEINVADVSAGGTWRLEIQEDESPWDNMALNAYNSGTGTISFDYAAAMGWSSGIHAFKVQISMEGAAGEYIVIDSVRIYGNGTPTFTPTETPTITPSPVLSATPTSTVSPDFTHTVTPTITPSPTISPTTTPSPQYTMTSTPTITPTVTTYLLNEDFIGTAGNVPADWVGDNGSNNFNASIAYSDTESYGAITRTASSDWGKVQSPVLTYQEQYPVLAISVQGISDSTTWQVGIREAEGTYALYDCDTATDETGVFYFNIGQVTGWTSGGHLFQVEISISGAAGTYVELDYIRIGVQSIQPPTPTVTRTPVPYNEFRPAANLFQPKQGQLELYFKIRSVERATIKVYNLAGRKVRTLLDERYPGQIDDRIHWDGKNDNGDWVGSGVYVIRIEAKNTEDQSRYLKNIRVVVVK